jgi:hypothetical protein
MFKSEKYICELRQAVSWAAMNHEVWWVYKSDETRPRYVDTMNRYNLFFRTAIHAHFVALLTALYRIYETRRDTYNLPNCLKRLREQGTLDSATLDELDALYHDAKPLWAKASVLRNEAFSHRALDLDFDVVFRKAAVTPNQLKALIENTQVLINGLSHAVDRSMHEFNTGAREDTIRLLEDLGN